MIRLSLSTACNIACLQWDMSASNSISISKRQVEAGMFFISDVDLAPQHATGATSGVPAA